MQVIDEFTLRQITVVCPTCKSMFATHYIDSMPDITRDTKVEADLHRVLPAQVRGALVTICAGCHSAWWVTGFQPSTFDPNFVPQTPKIDDSKKFARAVLTGRENGAHAFDLATLALNGLWCAREAGQPADKWLELCKKELSEALSDEQLFGGREGDKAYYGFVLGEICRQAKDFKGAVECFELARAISELPVELTEGQKALALAKIPEPKLLPPHMVEAIFCSERAQQLSKTA